MLHTTLDLSTVRTNTGMTALFAIIGDREVYLGESPAIGAKRAKLDILNVDPNVGSGRALAAKLARLERDADQWAQDALLALEREFPVRDEDERDF